MGKRLSSVWSVDRCNGIFTKKEVCANLLKIGPCRHKVTGVGMQFKTDISEAA